MPDLIKLLPEGSSVIAVIVIVILFLKQQREQEKRLEAITNSFNERIGEVTKAFQNQIDRIAQQLFQHQAETENRFQQLFDGFMNVSRETISAVVELKSAVDSIGKRLERISRQEQGRINKMEDDQAK